MELTPPHMSQIGFIKLLSTKMQMQPITVCSIKRHLLLVAKAMVTFLAVDEQGKGFWPHFRK